MKKWFCVLIIWVWVALLCASNSSLLGYPYALYSKETKAAAGGAGLLFLYPDDSLRTVWGDEVPPDAFIMNAMYSQKNQFQFFILPELYWAKGRLVTSLMLGYRDWPTEFYGIGNNTQEKNEQKYVSEQVEIKPGIEYYFSKQLSAKLDYRYRRFRNYDIDPGLLMAGMICGCSETEAAGLGIAWEYDATEERFYPKTGNKSKIEYIHFSEVLGGQTGFEKISFDLRQYFPVLGDQVLAVQAFCGWQNGQVPYQEMFELGYNLRGYVSTRFIGTRLLFGRSELRVFPFKRNLWNRLGFVMFAEAGQVGLQWQDICLSEIKPSGGFGFRFMALPKEKLNFRIDFGWGEDSNNFTFSMREAF